MCLRGQACGSLVLGRCALHAHLSSGGLRLAVRISRRLEDRARLSTWEGGRLLALHLTFPTSRAGQAFGRSRSRSLRARRCKHAPPRASPRPSRIGPCGRSSSSRWAGSHVPSLRLLHSTHDDGIRLTGRLQTGTRTATVYIRPCTGLVREEALLFGPSGTDSSSERERLA